MRFLDEIEHVPRQWGTERFGYGFRVRQDIEGPDPRSRIEGRDIAGIFGASNRKILLSQTASLIILLLVIESNPL